MRKRRRRWLDWPEIYEDSLVPPSLGVHIWCFSIGCKRFEFSFICILIFFPHFFIHKFAVTPTIRQSWFGRLNSGRTIRPWRLRCSSCSPNWCKIDRSVCNSSCLVRTGFSCSARHRRWFAATVSYGFTIEYIIRTNCVLCVNIGSRILSLDVPKDQQYPMRLKGISVCFTMLKGAMCGNYVNFGVFKLYGDDSLDNVLNMAAKLIISIPQADLIVHETSWTHTKDSEIIERWFALQEYPKLSKSYFLLLECLAMDHITFLSTLDATILVYILESLCEGLTAMGNWDCTLLPNIYFNQMFNIFHIDPTVCTGCCSTLDNIVSFIFKQLALKGWIYSLKYGWNNKITIEIFRSIYVPIEEIPPQQCSGQRYVPEGHGSASRCPAAHSVHHFEYGDVRGLQEPVVHVAAAAWPDSAQRGLFHVTKSHSIYKFDFCANRVVVFFVWFFSVRSKRTSFDRSRWRNRKRWPFGSAT